jgi:lipopolysaccharide transport system ATP-binding protein
MSSEVAIKVEGLRKCFQIYDQPRDRLKQFVLPRMQQLISSRPKQYYREFWALKDVSFEVKKSESVGIIGRNGSGKSTLLQIITGTLAPTSGSVTTNGRIAALLELGSGFNPEFTGRENVYLNGALLGFSTDQINEKFDAIASFADIGEHLEQPVKTYSSGMLVRLAFAVQVQVEPDILIVDEALAVGDALFQKRCFQRIEKLVSDGTTLLFVSHDQESVRTLTNRVLLLNKGHPIEWGLSSEVVLSYRKLLHDEETTHFASLTKNMVERAAQVQPPGALPATAHVPLNVNAANTVRGTSSRSGRLSFGDCEVKILGVGICNAEGEPTTIFRPGEKLFIRVCCEAQRNVSNLSVIIRLRNKEGIKIYSWGTLNQDMNIWATGRTDSTFWDRNFVETEKFEVTFECDVRLGENLYEVQAGVSHEDTPNYSAHRILHWIDEAAFFQVLMERNVRLFSGVTDLAMRAKWNAYDK